MGLDSYIQTTNHIETNSEGIITNTADSDEIGYWRKCWFIHEFFADIYRETIDPTDTEFNCTKMQVDLELLYQLHKAMCDEAYTQSLSFEDISQPVAVSTCEIDELKKVINYAKDNPNSLLYYFGWY